MAGTVFRLARPFIHRLDAERAHRLALQAAALGLFRCRSAPDPILAQSLWGLRFASPVGLAAGFDKDAEAPDALLDWGFGFVEIGSVTPLPQPGNPRPRLFRLTSDEAVINRMGFNSKGHAEAAARLKARRRPGAGPVGVNLGSNKGSADPGGDYVAGVAALGRFADYLVVNVSSPNTPGLRALQAGDILAQLLSRVLAARDALPGGHRPPVLVKIAPDLSDADKEAIAAAVLAAPADGLICTNTTIARPDSLADGHRAESGGLSGRPLMPLATAVLGDFYRLTGGRVPLIGVGGIFDGSDAYAKIRAGASLLQLYTAMVYRGPLVAARIAVELAACLRADGFTSIEAAVGAGVR
jgi:dihydroorotate dehydrogenase